MKATQFEDVLLGNLLHQRQVASYCLDLGRKQLMKHRGESLLFQFKKKYFFPLKHKTEKRKSIIGCNMNLVAEANIHVF